MIMKYNNLDEFLYSVYLKRDAVEKLWAEKGTLQAEEHYTSK